MAESRAACSYNGHKNCQSSSRQLSILSIPSDPPPIASVSVHTPLSSTAPIASMRLKRQDTAEPVYIPGSIKWRQYSKKQISSCGKEAQLPTADSTPPPQLKAAKQLNDHVYPAKSCVPFESVFSPKSPCLSSLPFS